MTLVAERVQLSRVNVEVDKIVAGGESSARSFKEKVSDWPPSPRGCCTLFSDDAKPPNPAAVEEAHSWRAQERAKYQLWPSPNLPGSSSRLTNPKVRTRLTRPPRRTSSLQYIRGAQATLNNAPQSQAQDRTIFSRRKRSVARLALPALTTVQESPLDSRKRHHFWFMWMS